MSTKPTNSESSELAEKKAAPKKRAAAKKPSPTAQILANVEMLVELHENPGKSDESFDALLEQIESFKQESVQLNERTNLLVQKLENSQPQESPQSNDDVLEWLEISNKELIEAIDSKIDNKLESLNQRLPQSSNKDDSSQVDFSGLLATQTNSLDSKLEERFNSLNDQVSEIAAQLEQNATDKDNKDGGSNQVDFSELLATQSSDLESKLDDRFQSLNDRVSEIATQLEQNANKQGGNPSSESANLIDELEKQTKQQSEQFEETLELFAEQLNQQTDSAVASVDQKVEDRFTKLDTRLQSLVALVESKPQSSGDPSTGEFSEASLGLINEAFDSKTSEVMELLSENFDSRLDELDSRISRITNAIEGQQALIESIRENSADTGAINDKTDVIVGTFKNQIDDLFESVGSRIARFSEFLARQEVSENAPAAVAAPEEEKENTSSHWERQKAAMLSKYGIDPKHRPSNELPGTEKTKVGPEEPIVLEEQASEDLGQLHNSIDSVSAEDAEAIDKLKEDLTSKLREAEIELSINRARLSQQKAELEEKQVEIERREESLKKKSAYRQATVTAKPGMLERIKVQLGMDKTDRN